MTECSETSQICYYAANLAKAVKEEDGDEFSRLHDSIAKVIDKNELQTVENLAQKYSDSSYSLLKHKIKWLEEYGGVSTITKENIQATHHQVLEKVQMKTTVKEKELELYRKSEGALSSLRYENIDVSSLKFSPGQGSMIDICQKMNSRTRYISSLNIHLRQDINENSKTTHSNPFTEQISNTSDNLTLNRSRQNDEMSKYGIEMKIMSNVSDPIKFDMLQSKTKINSANNDFCEENPKKHVLKQNDSNPNDCWNWSPVEDSKNKGDNQDRNCKMKRKNRKTKKKSNVDVGALAQNSDATIRAKSTRSVRRRKLVDARKLEKSHEAINQPGSNESLSNIPKDQDSDQLHKQTSHKSTITESKKKKPKRKIKGNQMDRGTCSPSSEYLKSNSLPGHGFGSSAHTEKSNVMHQEVLTVENEQQSTKISIGRTKNEVDIKTGKSGKSGVNDVEEADISLQDDAMQCSLLCLEEYKFTTQSPCKEVRPIPGSEFQQLDVSKANRIKRTLALDSDGCSFASSSEDSSSSILQELSVNPGTTSPHFEKSAVISEDSSKHFGESILDTTNELMNLMCNDWGLDFFNEEFISEDLSTCSPKNIEFESFQAKNKEYPMSSTHTLISSGQHEHNGKLKKCRHANAVMKSPKFDHKGAIEFIQKEWKKVFEEKGRNLPKYL